MDLTVMALMIIVMAGVTYLIRMIPFVFFRKKIKSRYVLSLLYYVPYAVLSAMTFPYIFYQTGNVLTAIIGTAVALIASVCKRSLLTVAILSCLSVFIFGFILV
ncbi:MAG: AzlD domain-containing protein [Clostridia bacterium]|nr:AzlD domain-containing protein [Clostridia bacterium]